MYKSEPVLTFWSGEVMDGHGRGSFHILNQSYTVVAQFQAAGFGDAMGDLHEFEITANDTALVAVYHPIPWDLSELGGSEYGWLLDCTFQEIDIETGELLFHWNASDHIGINETYETLYVSDGRTENTAWDFFHLNSIQKDADGDYLVSGRVTNCIYKISGKDGHIIWRLQVKQSVKSYGLHVRHTLTCTSTFRSDFTVDPSAEFAFQHDARWLDANQISMTLFSNGPTSNLNHSRGLLLAIDQESMTATLIQSFTNEAQAFGQYKGSVQAIDPSNSTTNFLVGYGSVPYFAEFDYKGNVLLDVQWGSTNAVNGYRAYKQ